MHIGHSAEPRSCAFGIAVMRCQAARMTEGWKHLINHMAAHHEVIIVFLGDHGGVPNEHDSLTVPMRAAMLRDTLPQLNLIIKGLPNNPLSHELWSESLDREIDDIVPKHRGVVLYDGRDGFTKDYTGKYRGQCVRIENLEGSGTEARLAYTFPNTEDARIAVIVEHRDRPGYGYSTVDNAIYDPATDEFILTAKKIFGDLRAFCGGHWDKKDRTMEMTSDRERAEEVIGIRTSPSKQLYTMPCDDPRYRDSEKDGTVTTICVSLYPVS